MIPPPHDQRHNPIPVATSFAYERFDLAPCFGSVESMQVEAPVDAIRAASKAPYLTRVDIETPSFDPLAIVDNFEPRPIGNEHLQRITCVGIEVLGWYWFARIDLVA
jgi:hypothetical protein